MSSSTILFPCQSELLTPVILNLNEVKGKNLFGMSYAKVLTPFAAAPGRLEKLSLSSRLLPSIISLNVICRIAVIHKSFCYNKSGVACFILEKRGGKIKLSVSYVRSF
jgi:hypothetical protein